MNEREKLEQEMKIGDRIYIPAVVKELTNEYGRVFVTCDSDEDMYVDAESIQAVPPQAGPETRCNQNDRERSTKMIQILAEVARGKYAINIDNCKTLAQCREQVSNGNERLMELVFALKPFVYGAAEPLRELERKVVEAAKVWRKTWPELDSALGDAVDALAAGSKQATKEGCK